MHFELDSFIDECRTALKSDAPQKSVRELAARAVADCKSVLKGLGEPAQGGIQTLHRSPDLTVLNVIWAPKMTIFPHNHTMWAVIGIYGGREDNIFWKRRPEAADGRIEAAAARSLCDGDAVALGADVIHSVTNPIAKLTGAIHIYGGDFFNPYRSEWDPESLTERSCDVNRILRQFEEDNRRWFAAG